MCKVLNKTNVSCSQGGVSVMDQTYTGPTITQICTNIVMTAIEEM